MSNQNRETFFQWIGNSFLVLGIPFCITLYIKITESWPYLPLKKFFNNGHSTRYMDGAKDVIGTGIFIITAGIILSIKWLVTKNKKNTLTNNSDENEKTNF